MQLKVLDDIEAIGQEYIVHEKDWVNEDVFGRVIALIVDVDDQAFYVFAAQVIDYVRALSTIIRHK